MTMPSYNMSAARPLFNIVGDTESSKRRFTTVVLLLASPPTLSDAVFSTTTGNIMPKSTTRFKGTPELDSGLMKPVNMDGKLTTAYSGATSRTIPNSFVPFAIF